MELMQNKIKEYFKDLKFKADTHTYEVRGNPLTSVSKTIHKYVEEVDFDKIAGFVAKKRTRDTGIYTTKEQILAEWEAKKVNSCNQGTKTHDFGENYTGLQEPTNGFERAIVNFWDNIPDHIEPFLFELKMYSTTLGLAGTSDIILYNNNTGKFIIADYKTNKDLFKNFQGQEMLAPFRDKLDNRFNHYVIQLSFYQILLKQICKLEIAGRKIIYLRRDGNYDIYNVPDVTNLLSLELDKNYEKWHQQAS